MLKKVSGMELEVAVNIPIYVRERERERRRVQRFSVLAEKPRTDTHLHRNHTE